MPTRDAYTAAMQNPGDRFRDPELANGTTVRKEASGQPIVYSGQFAIVYRMSCPGRDHAVRCFVSEAPNRQQRYRALSDHLSIVQPPGFVSITYLEQELLIGGERHPVLKMDWVEGQTLDKYIAANLANPSALRALVAGWSQLMKDLQSMPIAHNDLQHGNIIVSPTGDFRLVDYDGVFLAQFKGELSPELGHRNYQHPSRTAQDYDENIDNFPALVIHLSLLAIARDPSLWDRCHDGEKLLFTRADLADPGATLLWSQLERCPDPEVRRLTAELERCCRLPVAQVPTLEAVLTGRTTAGSTSRQTGGPNRLVLKTAAAQHRRSPGPTSAPRRPARPSGQPHVSLPNAAASIIGPGTGTAGAKSLRTLPRTRLVQLAHFVRKAMTVTACTIGVTRKATRRAMLAWRDIDLAARRHGNLLVGVTLFTFLVGSVAAVMMYGFSGGAAQSADQSALTVSGVSVGTATITVTAADADGAVVSDGFEVVVVRKYAALIAQVYEWRNDPNGVNNKSHTDRWDRALLAFGETVADTSLTPMTAAEARQMAGKHMASRWNPVAEALAEIEAGGSG